MSTVQYISRSCTFDSGHRVMNETMKCFNMHGHTYLCEVEFEFTESEDIGYAIDFKEIKRVGLQWIDDLLDHGQIVNPHDSHVITAALATKSKIWYMSLNGEGNYCNPSVECVAREIFLAMEVLFLKYPTLKINSISLNETPSCKTKCIKESISATERGNFNHANFLKISEYANTKGKYEYDDRKIR